MDNKDELIYRYFIQNDLDANSDRTIIHSVQPIHTGDVIRLFDYEDSSIAEEYKVTAVIKEYIKYHHESFETPKTVKAGITKRDNINILLVENWNPGRE